MCIHREHRTGNCRECRPKLASGGMIQPMVDPYRPREVEMPDRWDGDDS